MKDKRIDDSTVWTLLLTAVLLMLLLSCTKTVYIPVEHKTTETIETIVRDTIVEVDMPSERVEVETTDSVSVLTTDRATSRAEVSGGKLHHSLYVFPQIVPVTVPTVTVSKTRTDSVPYPEEVEKVVEVVPSWSWWSLAVAGVCVAGCTLYIIGNMKKV